MESEYDSCESDLDLVQWTALHMPDEALEIDFPSEHWSEVSSLHDMYDDRALAADNLKVFHGLQERWPGGFFQVTGDEWELGRLLGMGSQTEVLEARRTLPEGTKEKWVLKRFRNRLPLRDLMAMFPTGMLTNLGPSGRYSNNHCCSIFGVMMLQDGRFAILMKRYWGELRRLVDLKMKLNMNQDRPFSDMSIVIQIMLEIALGLQALHEDGIVHRDVKASNVLIWPLGDDYDPVYGGKFVCHVADFEVSVGVSGTGFWRAPEILAAINNKEITEILCTEKSDVYSFGMTCYEILTGLIPFEELGRGRALRDAVVHQKLRPVIPKSIDPWIMQLLGMCWLPDPLQRPSFEDIVDFLQARLKERSPPHILAPRPSTWEELNDPRVQRNQDLSMEIPEKLPIMIEMLAVSLRCCEHRLGDIKSREDQVGLFKLQCAHLVTALSSDADKMFRRFQRVRQFLKQPVIINAHRQRLELKYWFTCVAFGIHSLVDLARNFQMVVEMLSECNAGDWWKTALRYSTAPPHSQIPRWSVFGLALRQCQWSMDIAHLAINEMTHLANGFGDWMFNDPRFHWCEERRRVVRQTTEELSGSLQVAVTLEAQDTAELLKKLVSFLDKVPSKSSQDKAHKNKFRLASFLKTKLDGPTPDAKYSPYSFQIYPPVNLVSRSPVTAIWCNNISCYVKKVKAQGFEIRKRMEMEAAPLAAVQHPNVVRLIGYTVQTSGHETGLTEILTKLVHPSKEKDLHDEATGMLVMELMEGSLRNLLDRRCPNPGPDSRPFPLIVALDIMLQIAEAMRFVHEHKILHRDLKTENILFTSASTGTLPSYPTLDLDRVRELKLLYLLTPERFYTVKLADFDLAKYSPNDSSLIVDAYIGSAPYMAPEMFYNSEAEVPSEYNWSCDVYSFAMTCSAILTGNEPFHFVKNSTKCNVMASVVDKTAQILVRPDLGLEDALPSLKSLIERCWDKDPLKRPPFSEICKELWDCKVRATISCLRRQ